MGLKGSGTQTATLATEHTLATITPVTAGEMMQLYVDIAALTGDEVVTLRVKTKVLSGGTQRTMFNETYSSQQAGIEPIIALPPFQFDQDAAFTLEQNNGIGRSFPWKVLSPG